MYEPEIHLAQVNWLRVKAWRGRKGGEKWRRRERETETARERERENCNKFKERDIVDKGESTDRQSVVDIDINTDTNPLTHIQIYGDRQGGDRGVIPPCFGGKSQGASEGVEIR